MSGILLLLVASIWIGATAWLSTVVTARLSTTRWRVPTGILVFAALLPLPLIDEFVGGRQFKRLCEENATIQVDREKAEGKTVYLAKSSDVEIKGMAVRIVMKQWRFIDASSGETLVGYNTLIADGGRFVRALGISEGGVPLTFKGSCEPGGVVDSVRLLRDLKVTQINRSTLGKD